MKSTNILIVSHAFLIIMFCLLCLTSSSRLSQANKEIDNDAKNKKRTISRSKAIPNQKIHNTVRKEENKKTEIELLENEYLLEVNQDNQNKINSTVFSRIKSSFNSFLGYFIAEKNKVDSNSQATSTTSTNKVITPTRVAPLPIMIEKEKENPLFERFLEHPSFSNNAFSVYNGGVAQPHLNENQNTIYKINLDNSHHNLEKARNNYKEAHSLSNNKHSPKASSEKFSGFLQ